MLSIACFIYCYAECLYVECRWAECRGAGWKGLQVTITLAVYKHW
jgi:hypothetical protein